MVRFITTSPWGLIITTGEQFYAGVGASALEFGNMSQVIFWRGLAMGLLCAASQPRGKQAFIHAGHPAAGSVAQQGSVMNLCKVLGDGP